MNEITIKSLYELIDKVESRQDEITQEFWEDLSECFDGNESMKKLVIQMFSTGYKSSLIILKKYFEKITQIGGDDEK